ncbi:MAG: biopolymer transport protein ExbD [Candidatus Omnitrophota bacterium]|jgi:biopolymer transport protein ExbD
MSSLKSLGTPKIEMLPLVDVMFLLLAAFVLASAQMTSAKGIPVGLAEAQHANQLIAQKDNVYLSIDAEGLPYWDGEAVSVPDLNLKLHDISVLRNRKIILQADANTRHQSVIRIMDLMRQNQIFDVVMSVTDKNNSSNSL